MPRKAFTIINEFINNESYSPSLQFDIEYDLKHYIEKHWWKIKFLPESLFIHKLNKLLHNFGTYLGQLCGTCYHIKYLINIFVHYDNTTDYIIYLTGIWTDYKLMS